MLSVAIFSGDDGLVHIERCLKSLKPLYPEIIFVDTSESKKISKIVKKYTNKIFYEPWRNDFAWHRNHSFGFCTGDWILQIDADEEIIYDNPETADMLLKSLKFIKKEIHAVSLTLKDWRESLKVFAAESDAIRIFRRGKVNWVRPIHNEAMFKGEAAIFKAAHLVHYGYDLTSEQTKKKSERTIGLLKKCIEDDPTDYDSLFYLAQAYGSYENEPGITLKYCNQYILKKEEIGNKFNSSIYHLAASLYLSHQDYENAQHVIDEAIKNDPMDLDILFDWMKYGIATKNPKVIAIASQRFVFTFEHMPELRTKSGGRFFFNYNLGSYAKALYYVSISYLENGVIELSKLKDLFGKLPEDQVYMMKQKIISDLEKLKIRGLIDEPKIITNFDNLNPVPSGQKAINSL